MIKILKCAVCGSDSFNHYLETEDYFFTKEKFNLSKCKSCGFVFTNPLPLVSEIGKYYETEKYFSHNTENKGIFSRIYSQVRNLNLKNKYNIIEKYKLSGRLLDIGCGTGEFLNFGLRKSWKVKGIEPNANAREFATTNYGIEIGDENDLNEMDGSLFDVVTMWHVLEHVYNLNERMLTISKILKNDGIAIIALPMIDSPDSIKFGKYWAGLDVPRHLHHFSSASFEKLATKNNFKVIDKYPMIFDSFYVSWLSRQAKGNSFAFLRGVIDGLISNIRAKSNSNYSSMIFVIKKLVKYNYL